MINMMLKIQSNNLVPGHFSESLFQLLSNSLKLFLFAYKFILQAINFFLELLDRFFCKFCPGFSLLQLCSKSFNLLFVTLFSFIGLFFSNFKRFKIVCNNS